MYGLNVPSKIQDYKLFMDATNLRLDDNKNTPSDSTQIESNEITSVNSYSTHEYNLNELCPSDSSSLITNLDQTIQSTKKIKLKNEKANRYKNAHSPEKISSSHVSTKICKVCGDKSLGYNFSQVTCESCKAFFRRNALRKKNFKCPFTDNCEIDVVTRRFCQKCRLKKCFSIGMKSEWILSEEEKRLKRLKIEENKKKRRNQNANSDYVPYLLNNYSNGTLESDVLPKSSSTSEIAISTLGNNSNSSNPTVNQLQFDDSNNYLIMQSPTDYYEPSINFSAYGEPTQQLMQQPEFVHQLVHSHYEQYKTTFDYDPTVKWESSPQYFSNLNLNSLSDQFISEPINLPSKFNSSFTNDTINSSMSISNINSSNHLDNNNNINYNEITINTVSQQGQIPPKISKFMTIYCLPDSLMIDQIFEQAVSFKLCSNDSSNLTNYSFSNNEIDLINELIYATSNAGCVMDAFTSKEEPIAPEDVIFELLKMTDYAVRKSIKVAKKLTLFRSLCEEDQISALKGSSTEMMLCRTINMYDEETDMICKPETINAPKIRLDILKSIREEIYYDHKEMILSFKKELRQDTTLVSILMAILLFQPERPHIQHRTVMKYIQTTYRFLLKRYIYVNISKENIPIFEQLIQNLSKLKKLNEKYIDAYVPLNSEIIGPLLMEVFDF